MLNAESNSNITVKYGQLRTVRGLKGVAVAAHNSVMILENIIVNHLNLKSVVAAAGYSLIVLENVIVGHSHLKDVVAYTRDYSLIILENVIADHLHLQNVAVAYNSRLYLNDINMTDIHFSNTFVYSDSSYVNMSRIKINGSSFGTYGVFQGITNVNIKDFYLHNSLVEGVAFSIQMNNDVSWSGLKISKCSKESTI